MSTGILYSCFPNMACLPYKVCEDISAFFSTDQIAMCKHSIKTLRQVCDLPITVFTDQPQLFDGMVDEPNWWDVSVVHIDRKLNHTGDKVESWLLTPYDTTIFLDCDTEILADPREMMDDGYDLLACRELVSMAQGKLWMGYSHNINTGIMVYNNTPSVRSVFLDTYVYLRHNHLIQKLDAIASEQPIVNRFLYTKDGTCKVAMNILPSKWNIRGPIYNSIQDKKIIHSHGLNDTAKREGFIEWANDWHPHCLDLMGVNTCNEVEC